MIASVLLAVVLAPQQVQTYDLRIKGKVGDTYKTQLTAVMKPVGPEGQMTFTMLTTQKLKLNQRQSRPLGRDLQSCQGGGFRGYERGGSPVPRP